MGPDGSAYANPAKVTVWEAKYMEMLLENEMLLVDDLGNQGRIARRSALACRARLQSSLE